MMKILRSKCCFDYLQKKPFFLLQRKLNLYKYYEGNFMPDKLRIDLLNGIGLTKTESLVYLTLLKESPLTGYKIAEKISKSRSNTYQSLKSLENKQIVNLLEGNDTAQYIPVPIDQVMEQKERELLEQKKLIKGAFNDIKKSSSENQIYNIKTTDQLLKQSVEIIQSAKDILLVDSSPKALLLIREELIATAERGVIVLIETSEDIDMGKCILIKCSGVIGTTDPWENVGFIALSKDAEKTLVSFLNASTGKLISATWISNLFLSNWFANGMMYEIMVRYIANLFISEEDFPKEEIWEKIKVFYKNYMIQSKGDKRLKEILKKYADINE